MAKRAGRLDVNHTTKITYFGTSPGGRANTLEESSAFNTDGVTAVSELLAAIPKPVLRHAVLHHQVVNVNALPPPGPPPAPTARQDQAGDTELVVSIRHAPSYRVSVAALPVALAAEAVYRRARLAECEIAFKMSPSAHVVVDLSYAITVVDEAADLDAPEVDEWEEVEPCEGGAGGAGLN